MDNIIRHIQPYGVLATALQNAYDSNDEVSALIVWQNKMGSQSNLFLQANPDHGDNGDKLVLHKQSGSDKTGNVDTTPSRKQFDNDKTVKTPASSKEDQQFPTQPTPTPAKVAL